MHLWAWHCSLQCRYCSTKATINVHPEQGKEIISKHIYGQFAEHLGTCIYGGLWVGEDSKFPIPKAIVMMCFRL